MSFRLGCHRPFHRSEPVSARCLCCLRIACCSLFGFCLFLLLPPSTICFSIFSLQPSSLFDPSPCIYPAGAYCFLWKERDSDPRCPMLSSPPVQSTIHSAAIPVLPSTTQPSFLFPSRRAASQPGQQNQHQRCHDAIHHTLPAGKMLTQKVFDNVVHNRIVLLVLHVPKFPFLDHPLDVVQWVSPSCHPSLS